MLFLWMIIIFLLIVVLLKYNEHNEINDYITANIMAETMIEGNEPVAPEPVMTPTPTPPTSTTPNVVIGEGGEVKLTIPSSILSTITNIVSRVMPLMSGAEIGSGTPVSTTATGPPIITTENINTNDYLAVLSTMTGGGGGGGVGGGSGVVAIKRTEIEKTFGNEKNKLVLTHTGKYVVEFLYHYYPHLFSYEYTREMEEKLDIIATVPETSWWPVCIDCIDEIKTNSKVVFSVAKEILTIDASNQLFFSKCGPVVYQKQPNGETIMCSIRNDVYIDIEKIHTYTPDMLLDVPRPFLGIVEGGYVFIKNGIYGAYIEWTWGKDGERNKNIPLKEYFAHHKDKTMGDLLLEDVMPLLMGETQNKSQHKGIVRDFGGGINIRKGDKGLYVFVKKENVRKPLFISLKKCPLDVETGTDEEWLAWIGTH